MVNCSDENGSRWMTAPIKLAECHDVMISMMTITIIIIMIQMPKFGTNKCGKNCPKIGEVRTPRSEHFWRSGDVKMDARRRRFYLFSVVVKVDVCS
jgi:hypothetical protein